MTLNRNCFSKARSATRSRATALALCVLATSISSGDANAEAEPLLDEGGGATVIWEDGGAVVVPGSGDAAAAEAAAEVVEAVEEEVAPVEVPETTVAEEVPEEAVTEAVAEEADAAATTDEVVEATTESTDGEEAGVAEEEILVLDTDDGAFTFEDGQEAIVFQDIPSVYGVSRFEQKITEAPSFVTLITSDEITKYGYRTLAEALQSVTGFFVTYDRNYNYLGVRGFQRPGDYNARVLLLVDGHRLNDNLYQQAGLGTESVIDIDLVDRIEVIRGPSSSVYGTNAFFGVINVITKRGRDVRGVEFSGELGSYDTYRARSTYGDKFSNGIELLLSGSYYNSQGRERLFYKEFDSPTTNNGITQDADDDEFPSVFAKLAFRGLTLQGGFVSREKGVPTASFGTSFPTSRTETTDEHAYAFMRYEHSFDSQVNVSGRVYYDRFYYQGDYLYAPVLNRDKSTGEWWGAEASVDKRFFDRWKVSAGSEVRHNFRQDLWNADVDPSSARMTFLDDKRDSWNIGIFHQHELEIIDDLIVNAGVRFDYYDSFGSTVNPRIALIYNLERTTFKALYGTAFRGPSAYERFYEGTGFKSNDDLDAETIATYELVLEHAITNYIRGTVTGYIYTIDDLISQETDPNDGLLVFRNRDEVEAKGIEFQVEMDDAGWMGIGGRVGYALQETKDKRTKKRLTNSPTHLVNVNLTAPIFEDKLFGAAEVMYTSGRKTEGRNRTNGYAVGNLTLLTKNLLRGLEISASVRNVLNREYGDPGSGAIHVQDTIEQNGRSFWLKVKYGF